MSEFLIDVDEYKAMEKTWEEEERERIAQLTNECMKIVNTTIQQYLKNRTKAPWVIELDLQFEPVIEIITKNISKKGFDVRYTVIQQDATNDDKYILLNIATN